MSRDISKLSPFMREKAAQFIAECEKQGLDIVVICTDRGRAEQQACFDSGASNALPGFSAHNVESEDGTPSSEAFDVGVIRHGKYIGNGSDPAYQKAGLIGEGLGLLWAGRWKGRLREAAHFQNPNWVKPKKRG